MVLGLGLSTATAFRPCQNITNLPRFVAAVVVVLVACSVAIEHAANITVHSPTFQSSNTDTTPQIQAQTEAQPRRKRSETENCILTELRMRRWPVRVATGIGSGIGVGLGSGAAVAVAAERKRRKKTAFSCRPKSNSQTSWQKLLTQKIQQAVIDVAARNAKKYVLNFEKKT